MTCVTDELLYIFSFIKGGVVHNNNAVFWKVWQPVDTIAVTGKPKPDSGIGAAETGGAILAVSDAPDGSYTRGPDGSMTGPNKGRSTSTGKFDKNGEEIYQRDSGGYYIVDENGIQRPVKSPYTNNGNITQKDNKYDWIDNERHPDPNVTSGFATTKPTPSSNQYFKTEAQWQAPGRGTGLNYKVYQQDIDFNARPIQDKKGILANGSANISAGGLDNQSGHIAADALEINLSSADSINNAQGQIQATKGVNLTANNSALLNNQGGQIVAGTVDLTVGNTDSRIDNNTADSLIQGGSKVNITTGIVDNQNTKQVGGDKTQGIIAGDTININTSSVNNKNGQVLTDGNNQPEQTQANDTIAINASSKVNNQSGIIQSQNIGITDNNTTSRNLVLNNDSGRIVANQDVALIAKSFSNQGGEILANGRADVNVIDDIRYTGTNSVNANDVALTTKGDFINTGVLSGQNALTINASTIDNQKDSELSSQGTTQLIATSNIDN